MLAAAALAVLASGCQAPESGAFDRGFGEPPDGVPGSRKRSRGGVVWLRSAAVWADV